MLSRRRELMKQCLLKDPFKMSNFVTNQNTSITQTHPMMKMTHTYIVVLHGAVVQAEPPDALPRKGRRVFKRRYDCLDIDTLCKNNLIVRKSFKLYFENL
jgi:hypothetical protein